MTSQVITTMRSSLTWVRRHPLVVTKAPGLLITLVAALVLTLGSGTAAAVGSVYYGVPAGAVFRASDTVMTEQQFETRIRLYGLIVGLQPPADPPQQDKFRRSVAKAVATEQVLDDVARARNIVVADKAASDQLNDMIDKIYPNGRDEFTAKLASAGVTEPDMLAAIKRQLATAQLYDEVTKDVAAPTDQDVTQAYEQHKAEMVTPEKRHIRNIAVASEAQANQVKAQLDQGADFAALAAQVSQDAETKDHGGDLGVAARRQIADAAFGDAAFATPPNAVFGPVQSNGIWSIGQVLEVAPPASLSLDQVRDQLRSHLFQQRKSEMWNRWISDQLKQADVKYADAYQPADPTGVTPDPGGPTGPAVEPPK